MTMRLPTSVLPRTLRRHRGTQSNFYRNLVTFPSASFREAQNHHCRHISVRRGLLTVTSPTPSTLTTISPASGSSACFSTRAIQNSRNTLSTSTEYFPPSKSSHYLWQLKLSRLGQAHSHEYLSRHQRSFSSKSGEDQHALFQKQLLELEEERRSLFGDSDLEDDPGGPNSNSPSLTDIANQQALRAQEDVGVGNAEDEQLMNEQEFHDLESSSDDSRSQNPGLLERNDEVLRTEDEDELEEMKEERELLFQFSREERTAWSQVAATATTSHHGGDKENSNDDDNNKSGQQDGDQQKKSLQRILAEVERLRVIERNGGSSSQVSQTAEQQRTHSQSLSSHDMTGSPLPSSSSSDPTDQHHESFSHVSSDGTSIHMVDVGSKDVTSRTATARTTMWLPPDVMDAFGLGKIENNLSKNTDELIGPKGPIFATAKLAGIMAAKKTSDLIPLCHPLPIDQVKIDIQLRQNQSSTSTGGRNACESGGGTVTIDCTCRVTHKTGVEMEALTGASVAALTIYDMTKAVSHQITINDTRLLTKTGGKRTVVGRKQ